MCVVDNWLTMCVVYEIWCWGCSWVCVVCFVCVCVDGMRCNTTPVGMQPHTHRPYTHPTSLYLYPHPLFPLAHPRCQWVDSGTHCTGLSGGSRSRGLCNLLVPPATCHAPGNSSHHGPIHAPGSSSLGCRVCAGGSHGGHGDDQDTQWVVSE